MNASYGFGEVVTIGGNIFIKYTPNTGYYGDDTMKYKICDNDGLCADASIFINILNSPARLSLSPVFKNSR